MKLVVATTNPGKVREIAGSVVQDDNHLEARDGSQMASAVVIQIEMK